MIVALRAPSLAKFGEVDTVPVSEKYTKHKDEKKHEKRREEKAPGAKIRLSRFPLALFGPGVFP